ncbi:MAG TPA: hypothetical protein VFH59_07380 [Frateuria sp.]|uniref:hypothetical protein n=1 Tax=Frateuria sp. TaxID=2211372 RepID=UPI002D7F3235|nr:hypothetical protein [Frateuria sp.]HET6805244.1 hypothetical protein [Frateuria sp.]
MSLRAAKAATLRHTLAACVPDLQRHCSDPWIVIGSAAALLVGAPVDVADLDVLTSVGDARSLIGHWQGRLLATDGLKDADRFRSHFARFAFPHPVEVMGGLEVATPEGWRPVRIGAIRMVEVDGLDVPVPTIQEQVRLLEWFDRPKDRLRAETLKNLKVTPA